jgi:hypothetical protein
MPSLSKQGLTHMVDKGLDPSGAPYGTDNAMAYNIWNDMRNNGFILSEARDENGDIATTLQAAVEVILTPSLTVDPLWNENKWEIYMSAEGNGVEQVDGQNFSAIRRGLYMKIGTPSQFTLPGDTNHSIAGAKAVALPKYPIMPEQFNTFGLDQEFLGVAKEWPRISVRHPGAYQLTIVERGFVLATWTQVLTEDMSKMGIVCVQRGVGCDGTMVTTGQKPLYMVTNITPVGVTTTQSPFLNMPSPRWNWYYQIIREFDTSVPMPNWQVYPSTNPYYPKNVMSLFYNSNLISDPLEILGQSINYFPTRWYTPVTTDTGEYILLFPFGLCTSRFAFSDELDLIAVSKADAYQSGQQVPITVYTQAREYTALNSNNQAPDVAYDSGIRVFILTKGGGADN